MKFIFLIVVGLTVAGCAFAAGGDILPCRYSSDYRICFIYLTKDIAIAKNTITGGDDVDKTYFSIVKARWVGEPDLANTTGDRAEENIVSSPKKIGMDGDSKYVFISGQDFNETNLSLVDRVWLIDLSAEKIYSANNEKALDRELKKTYYLAGNQT